MEELLELRECIEQGHYLEALTLVEEMEAMSKEDKLQKIGSFIEVLLLHLIKQHAEQRTTRSWDISIENALDSIEDVNRRRKAGGYYFAREELQETITRHVRRALRRASLEAFEGHFNETELLAKINDEQIRQEALERILQRQAE